MKLLTRDTDYAIRALAYFAGKRKGLVCVGELVRELEIPKPFLRKILQMLTKRHFLYSVKGAGGGFRLAKDPKDILIGGVTKVFQGPLKMNECMFKKELCPNRRTCKVKRRIDAIERNVARELMSITLKELI